MRFWAVILPVTICVVLFSAPEVEGGTVSVSFELKYYACTTSYCEPPEIAPATYLRVELWEADGPLAGGNKLLGTSYTNENGQVDFGSFENIDSGFLETGTRDLYFRIYTDTPAVDVKTDFGISTYCLDTPITYDVSSGPYNLQYVVPESNPTFNSAVFIACSIYETRKWFIENTDYTTPVPLKMTAWYPSVLSRLMDYYQPMRCIRVNRDMYSAYKDSIAHEYGHYIQHWLYDWGPLPNVLDHDASSYLPSDAAFVEGWADFVGGAATDGPIAGLDLESFRYFQDVSSPDEQVRGAGDHCEMTVAAALYDIYDDNQDVVFSGISTCPEIRESIHSLQRIVDVLRYDRPTTMNDFWAAYRQRYTAGPATWAIFDIQEMHHDSEAPTAPSGLTSSSHPIGQCTDSTVVNLSWNAASDDLSGVAGYVLSVTNEQSTSLSGIMPNVWFDATSTTISMNGMEGEFWVHLAVVDRVGVKSYQNDWQDQWSQTIHYGPICIIASDNDSYEPDDTYSEATWIYDGSPQIHSIIPPDDVDWVKFSLSTESEVIIETSGPSGDTRMWLYDSGLNQIEYDDDSGSDLFSSIYRTCGTDALPPGTYHVKIDEFGNDHEISSYNINLTVTACGGGNHDPQLSAGFVSPASGYASTDFYWYVDYYDEDGDAPASKQVYIDGTPYVMGLHSGSASNGTYRYGPVNMAVGSHNYYFYCSDGNGGTDRLPNGGTYTGPSVSAGGPVYFADINLKAAVEQRLGISNPTLADMLNLVGLDARYENITDLTGLEYATNLAWLDVAHNQISDLSPLSGLMNLNDLGVYYNQISDVSALSGLTNLMYLSMSGNQITNLSPLSGLTNLTELGLSANQISNISALSGLTNLTELDMWGNQISDISALSGLRNLTYLDLDINQISDISALSGMTNLTMLDLRDNPLNAAAYCTYLPLILANNPSIDLSYDPNPDPGADCPVPFLDFNLKTIVEEELGVSNPIQADMLNLIYLDASYRGIVDLTGLEYAMNLTSLNLNGNQVANISALSAMANLEQLFLSQNQISDISALSVLTNLTYLEIGANPLNIAAYCNYLPLIIDNNPGLSQLFYDSNPIDFPDFAILGTYWQDTGCGECGGADLTGDAKVDLYDLTEFVSNWLIDIE